MDQFIKTNNIQLHYLDHGGDKPPLILMPGLTANAHSFDALIDKGLSANFRVLALDLRGRGLSDKPATGYSMAEHSADVIGLMDALDIERTIIGGHSFGGLLTLYLAANFPERFHKLIVLDAAVGVVNPQVVELIRPALERLNKTFASWDEFLDAMKRAPFFNGWWDAAIESYYRADVETLEDGSVRPRAKAENIAEAITKAGAENWLNLVAQIRQPALLLHAPDPCGLPGAPPLITDEQAAATVAAIANCQYVRVPGNHYTMIYGAGAERIITAINSFLQ